MIHNYLPPEMHACPSQSKAITRTLWPYPIISIDLHYTIIRSRAFSPLPGSINRGAGQTRRSVSSTERVLSSRDSFPGSPCFLRRSLHTNWRPCIPTEKSRLRDDVRHVHICQNLFVFRRACSDQRCHPTLPFRVQTPDTSLRIPYQHMTPVRIHLSRPSKYPFLQPLHLLGEDCRMLIYTATTPVVDGRHA